MVELTCIVCGKIVWIKFAEAKYRKTCSRICYGKGRTQGLIRSSARRQTAKTKRCSDCGKQKPLKFFSKKSYKTLQGGYVGVQSRCCSCSKNRWANFYVDERRDVVLSKAAERHRQAKHDALYHYSQGTMQCECCHETLEAFLTLDHVKGDGAEHRRTLSSPDIAVWAKRNNYPPGLRVLCFNCNCGGRVNGGECPHKRAGVEHEAVREVVPEAFGKQVG